MYYSKCVQHFLFPGSINFHARHHCVMALFNHIAPLLQALSSFLTSPDTFTHLQSTVPGRAVEVFISVKSISAIFYHHIPYIFQHFDSLSFFFSFKIYSECTNVEDVSL